MIRATLRMSATVPAWAAVSASGGRRGALRRPWIKVEAGPRRARITAEIPRPPRAAIFAAAMASGLLFVAGQAMAHDWYTGQRSDYDMGLCCSGHDCIAIPAEQMARDREGRVITLGEGQHPLYPAGGRFRFTGVPRSSPDGNAHVCIYPPGREQNDRGEFDGVARCAWWGGGY